MNTDIDNVVIRELCGINECKTSEQFQRMVWGEDDPADNADLLLAIAHAGGLVAAAFHEDEMTGFIFGFPASDSNVQYSHRLGVHPDRQGSGLGARLKWFQRNWCLQRGIDAVRWTYDPARCANATLNVARLGAVAREYHDDYYGDMAGINAGVPSDRIVAEWCLQSPRVVALADGIKPPCAPDNIERFVDIPSDFNALLKTDKNKAFAERMRIRHELTQAFHSGFYITGFNPDTCQYTLSNLSS